MMKNKSKKYLIFCIAILCVASALRFYNLGSTCLWLDEALTANLIHGSFEQMLQSFRNACHSATILYPTLLWLIQGLISDPFWARIWSVIFGIATVVVLLCLPSVGVPKRVAALSAAILTFSGTQIQYSQEVREYSMGVFFCGLLTLLFFLLLNSTKGIASYISFLVVVIISTFATYGPIFFSMILVGLYSLNILLYDRKQVWRPMVLIFCFLVSLRACFLLTVVYQQNMPKLSLYDSFYPSGGIISSIVWLVNSTWEVVNFNLGFSGGLILIIMWIFAILLSQKRQQEEPDHGTQKIAILILLSLFLFMLLLAFLHRYPFGGFRSLLFASPLLIVCFALAYDFFWRITKVSRSIFYWVVPVFLFILQTSNLKTVYADQQDVIGPVELKPAEMSDQDVFIDAWGLPSIQYHFPNREFTKCKFQPSQLENIVEQINTMPREKRLVIFSERSVDEVRQLEVMLNRTNSKVELIKRYKEICLTQTFVFLVTR